MVTSKEGMRGLSIFIADIRNCRSREDESKRVNKEFSNIRTKFNDPKSLTSYNKRKYLSKLLFIFLLGYEVDVGFNEAVSLVLSNKYIDKKIAFLFLSIMIGPDHVSLKLINKSIKVELNSSDPIFRSVALEAITNMSNQVMATEFSSTVLDILLTPSSDDSNKQCAAIALLTLYRADPKQMEELNSNEQLISQIIQLLYNPNLSIMSAAVSLLTFLSSHNPSLYTGVISPTVARLEKIISVTSTDQLPDLRYHQVAAPFITVKLMKLLQTQTDLRNFESQLIQVISIINEQTSNKRSKKIQYLNALHALFFEAANLSVHCKMVGMCQLYLSHLLEMVSWDDSNYRYCALVVLEQMTHIPEVFEDLRPSLKVIINLLKTDPDENVKRTAISLLCSMCSRSDVTLIVSELIEYLKIASYDTKEDLAVKIPILCEQFISDSKWYVETILSLMISNGDLVGDEICNRVINMIMKKPDLQKYSVNVLYEALGSNDLHDNLVMMSAYVIGEFGHLVSIDPVKLVNSLHGMFFLCSRRTQYLMLSAYAKLCNLFPGVSQFVLTIFMDKNIWCSSDVELQKRANEYANMINLGNRQLIGDVFEEMPPYCKKDEDNSSAHSLFDNNAELVFFDSPEPSIISTEESMDVNLVKKQLLTSDSGLVFDGPNLSVSFLIERSAQQPSMINVVLTISSKGSQIEQINLILPKNDNPVIINITPGATLVPPFEQTSYNLLIMCMDVYKIQFPNLLLEYLCNTHFSKVSLPFPIPISKFFVNKPINPNLFMGRWGAISTDKEFKAVIRTHSNGNLLFSQIGNIGLSHIPNIDQIQGNFIASLIFYSKSHTIGLLVRFQPNNLLNQVGITMRCSERNEDLFYEFCSLIEIL